MKKNLFPQIIIFLFFVAGCSTFSDVKVNEKQPEEKVVSTKVYSKSSSEKVSSAVEEADEASPSGFMAYLEDTYLYQFFTQDLKASERIGVVTNLLEKIPYMIKWLILIIMLLIIIAVIRLSTTKMSILDRSASKT